MRVCVCVCVWGEIALHSLQVDACRWLNGTPIKFGPLPYPDIFWTPAQLGLRAVPTGRSDGGFQRR